MTEPNQPSYFDLLLQKKTWEDFFLRTPCVRSSLLWGIGCGSLMVAHKLHLYKRNVRHAVSAGVLTFTVISSTNFLICSNEFNQKYEMIRKGFEKKNIQEDRSNRPPLN